MYQIMWKQRDKGVACSDEPSEDNNLNLWLPSALQSFEMSFISAHFSSFSFPACNFLLFLVDSHCSHDVESTKQQTDIVRD